MPDEPDNLVLQLLRTMRAENSARFDAIEAGLEDARRLVNDVRLNVAGYDLRFDALDERVEMIREGTVSAIGFAANAGRAHVDLRQQIANLTRRVEKLESGR
jgi:hypothetical protein